MAITAHEIIWLAGIIEGEGNVTSMRGSPTVRIAMTDRDVIQRVASIWKSKVSGPYKPKRLGSKEVWSTGIHGYTAVGWMMTLFTWLGERRRSAVVQSVKLWVAAPGFARKVRGADGAVMSASCHPDRPLYARQKCRACYTKTWKLTSGWIRPSRSMKVT